MYLTAAILLIFRGKVEEHVKIMMLHFVLTSLTPAYHSLHSLSNGIQDSLGFWIPNFPGVRDAQPEIFENSGIRIPDMGQNKNFSDYPASRFNAVTYRATS